MAMPKKLKRLLLKYLILASGLIIIFMFLIKTNLLIIIILIAIASFSKFYKHFTGKMSIGFELVTPVVILFGYEVNILFAVITAIFMVIAADFISGRLIGTEVAMQVLIYTILAILAGIFSWVAFIPLAIFLIILRNVLMWLVMVVPGFVNPVNATLSTVPNIFINAFIVNLVGTSLITLL